MTNPCRIPTALVATVLPPLLTQLIQSQTTAVDDFTSPAKWALIQTSSPATTLSVTNGRMNYTTTSPSASGAFAVRVTPAPAWAIKSLPSTRRKWNSSSGRWSSRAPTP